VKQVTEVNTIRRTLFAYWITKSTNTRAEYKTFITFILQQMLPERT